MVGTICFDPEEPEKRFKIKDTFIHCSDGNIMIQLERVTRDDTTTTTLPFRSFCERWLVQMPEESSSIADLFLREGTVPEEDDDDDDDMNGFGIPWGLV